MKLAGATTTTKVIFAYQPCKTRKQATQATYAQQRRYWRLQGYAARMAGLANGQGEAQ